MPNRRIYYATQAVALKPIDENGSANANWYYPRGLQSVGISTNFNLTQVFQLGQLELYDDMEDVPEVEVTMTKNIDGTPPLYIMANMGTGSPSNASEKSLAALSNNRVNFRLMIHDDTDSAASGAPLSLLNCSGMYVSSVGYTFPIDGVATEELTLVGNHKVWATGSVGAPAAGCVDSIEGAGTNAFSSTSGNVNYPNQASPASARRFKVSGVYPRGTGGGIPDFAPIQNISINCSLNREPIFQLGQMTPYFRYVTFPVEVTSEFESIASTGDNVSADDFTCAPSNGDLCTRSYKNLDFKPISIIVCGSETSDKLTINLGSKNKLTSVNYTGGDTGGGNATVTYSFRNFNDLSLKAEGSFQATTRIVNS